MRNGWTDDQSPEEWYDEAHADWCETWDRAMDCPVHVDLERPLGDRTVIEVDDEQGLLLLVPDW